MKLTRLLAASLAALTWSAAHAADFTLDPAKPKQTVKGIGFEIQSDSIGSGNHGLPEEPIAVPHDLIPSERERLAKEMLRGFRYCRLAGGLYWRGLDPKGKFLKPRWPEQLQELKQLLDTAGVEGLSFEYWSPAPYWKANRAYYGSKTTGGHANNRLRCFAPDFDKDPEYKGDTDRFLKDFANAVVADIKTLQSAGIKVSKWGLQNEPFVSNFIYSSCVYPTSPNYVAAYRAVASAIRRHDPSILLFADTEGSFPRKIGPAMQDPEIASLVDAYCVHIVGSPCVTPLKVHEEITKKLPPRPWFQNEYEYLTGGATPDRSLNTVQHIMNSFQLAENPTWYWIHCLKPLKNAEASGYSLGFWKSRIETPKPNASAKQFRRWPEGPLYRSLPDDFKSMEMVSAKYAKPGETGIGYHFIVNQPVTVFLLAKEDSSLKLGAEWQPTGQNTTWEGGKDVVFKRTFKAGKVEVPGPGANLPPHLCFVQGSDPAKLNTQIGMNLPIQVRSTTIALEEKVAGIEPGHWIFNPYNWNAVGSFVRHMPWDSVVLHVDEAQKDNQARVLAFRKPNGKVTLVFSNRSETPRKVSAATQLPGATWKGSRYTPEEAGKDTMGVPCGALSGQEITTELPPRSWEFWEQQ